MTQATRPTISIKRDGKITQQEPVETPEAEVAQPKVTRPPFRAGNTAMSDKFYKSLLQKQVVYETINGAGGGGKFIGWDQYNLCIEHPNGMVVLLFKHGLISINENVWL